MQITRGQFAVRSDAGATLRAHALARRLRSQASLCRNLCSLVPQRRHLTPPSRGLACGQPLTSNVRHQKAAGPVKSQRHVYGFWVPASSSAWAVRPPAASARSVAIQAVFESAWSHVGGRSSTPRSLESLSLVIASGTLWAISATASLQRFAKAVQILRFVRPAS